jgi:hypothetical protein
MPATATTDGGAALMPLRWRVWAKRLGWLALIWALSVAALAVVALLLRMVMRGVGMAS